MRNKRWSALAFVVAGLVALGCGGGGSDTGTVSEGNAKPDSATSSEATTKKVATMGKDSVTLDGGVVVTVSKPAKFTPSGSAAGHQRGNTALLFSITVENQGDEPLDLSLAIVTAAFGAEGTQAEAVFDSSKNINSLFESTVAPGKKRTAKYVFSAPTKDTSEIAMTVQPAPFEDSTALFEGSL
ncbi:DUF4352 domain-containing protein [Micromonospora sp. WMMD1082]|uniref:DUF4352 domain-containing protein n=1 Tax=Micromonospora sp. WMMD1082 TaxID=3016104 RepID=UPI002416D7F9|nr:DUF4352 domain-containing protein [Micromonospora sp. WMMD1082]MDG4792689.1 DUF4352 domain-containing protein [Micromonospora sp. WMMD1082]